MCEAIIETALVMIGKVFKSVFACFCIFLFIIALVRIFGIEVPKSPKTVTREELAGFNNAIYVLVNNNNKPFQHLIEGNHDNFIITDNLKKIFYSEGMSSIWDHIEDGDGWGRKYNFAIRTNGQKLSHQTRNPLFVWSSGRNGLNEFGAGDDVCGNDELNYLIGSLGEESSK